ncbi:MAG TPA: SIMPL domain-containing protein [Pyrinomonadaceae bacterium]|nr:SIMPL domain-containing protein [Pyrinomonadaceae bacterium]
MRIIKSPTALIAALYLTFACSLPAFAQERALPSLITVTGEAEIRVVPDEVFFDLSVQTFNRDLKVAKAQTDDRLKKLAELTQKYGVAAKDTQTDYISVEPRYRGNNEARQLTGFLVRKDFVFTLRDVSKAEAMLSEIIEVGVTRINDIDFRTSELRKHRDQARANAIRAAREKAVALTGEIGQNIGKAYSIEEVVASGNSASQNNFMLNSSGSSGEGESSSGTLAIGQIKVNARVVVRFELK